AEVYAAVKAGVSYLFDAGCDEVVIACNTATTTCIGELRGEFSKPIIGTEPELKNALSGAEKPLLLATPLTYENLKNDSFETADTTSLSKIIEESVFCEKIRKDIACALVSESRKKVVLGCTHYLYLEKFLSCKTYDGGRGVANRAKSVLGANYRKTRRGGNLFIVFSGKKSFIKYLTAFSDFDAYNRNKVER
ncbi:MAG: aspartate/glutamate racemase family protein, partial [Eubacteriales bacterium]|nr:aspartate/glutamate racemase family protein [Eubacteriales bacterium]